MTWRIQYAGLCGGILAMLLLGACNPHEFPTSEGGDPGKDFSVRLQFVDDLPVLRTISADTKATAQAGAYRYSVELLRYVDDVAYKLTPDYVYSFTRSERISVLDTTVYLPIDPARYRVVAWVDRLDADAEAGYDVSDFEFISVAEGYDLRKGTRDAFTGTRVLDLEGYNTAGEVVQETLKLTRPVARIRFYAPEALTFLGRVGVDAASMKVSLRYTTPIAEGYNVLRDVTMSTLKDVSLTAVPEMNTDGELEFITDHLFTPAEGTTVNVDFRITGPKDQVLCSYVGAVPVQRGKETRITFTGSGGGGGGTSGGIGINPGFDSEIEVPIDLSN